MTDWQGFHYRWREGNRFGLLVDGDRFFPAMLAAIGEAREEICLGMYLFESGSVADRFIDALAGAARRGVAVHAMLDAYGALALKQHDRDRLSGSGIELVFYNPLRLTRWLANLVRDHRKLLIIDQGIVFTGGAGITDDFDPRQSTRRWHELMLRIEGPVVADWRELFARFWDSHTSSALPAARAAPAPLPGGMAGRVVQSRWPRLTEIPRSLLKRINSAERRVWFMTAYFVPSWKLKHALRRADRRGVDVRLLVPGPVTDHPGVRHAGRRFYSRLLAHGVRIFEYQPRFLHAKCVLIDDWATLGSSNHDRWNMRWNLEANQEIEDSRLAAEVQELFETDFAQSVECLYADWRARPWWERWREHFWGMVDHLLMRLGRRG
ncbi:MAG: cardiolipin synthase B [Candidatus Muproteobacteria bacterium RBG_16_62_13]|uniref:Cardiolipin synthase B n=1 Tax=Candidatus Muproteobacteria bacterium RBG_16_62_13 TaxID=1817756 RepID=A0A1F6SY17_9PROT|nr:MAG: cardiolipin synthase B [Candidatus Muproteobacteria bacterium RBG_16_62_13]